MISTVKFCTLVVVAVLLASCELQDEQSEEMPRNPVGIVGGTPTEDAIWRGVVGLQLLGENGAPLGICSGTLIHPQVVLTAGHCVFMRASVLAPEEDATKYPERLKVKAGAVIGQMGLKGELLSSVKEAVYHPQWDGELTRLSVEDWVSANPTKDFVDIALLHLETPVTNRGYYCIRQESEPNDSDEGVIVGYGLLGTDKAFSSGVLRWGETTLRKVHSDKTSNYIEVGDPTNVCNGDSGGPLFTQEGGKWRLTGVTSHGETAVCLKNQKSYETNAVRAYDWIAEQVKAWTGDSLGGCPLSGPNDADVDTETETDNDTALGSDEDTDSNGGVDTSADSDASSDASDDADDSDKDAREPAPEYEKSSKGCGCAVLGARTLSTGLLALVVWLTENF